MRTYKFILTVEVVEDAGLTEDEVRKALAERLLDTSFVSSVVEVDDDHHILVDGFWIEESKEGS